MKIHQTQTASYPGLEYLPCSAGTDYKAGQALVVTAGVATPATGATAPTYICFANKTGKADDTVQAIRVLKGEVFEAPLSVDGSALKIGDKVTIAADSIKVTATTNSGVAEIVGFCTEAKAAGDGVLIRF